MRRSLVAIFRKFVKESDGCAAVSVIAVAFLLFFVIWVELFWKAITR